jgi:hypothetical protein
MTLNLFSSDADGWASGARRTRQATTRLLSLAPERIPMYTKKPKNPKIGGRNEASALLGLSPFSCVRLAQQGKIPGAFLVGTNYRFDLDRLRTFVRNGGDLARQ